MAVLNRRQFSVLLASTAVAGTVTGLGPAFGQAPTKVKVAIAAFEDTLSLWVGVEKGIFAEEGIELEIQNADWSGAAELLVGGHVDIASNGDADVVTQNANGLDTTLAFPLFYFAGGALMYDPRKYPDWKTYHDLLDGGVSMVDAVRQSMEQVKGATIGVSATGSEYASLLEMVKVAGLKIEDYRIIDLSQEELPPALISGSIDIMISGTPQRMAVARQGYISLIDQTALPSTVAHAGYIAKRSWVDANTDTAVRLQRGIIRTLDYIEKNQDEAFPIISAKMRESGTEMPVEDIKAVWNVMTFFPNSKEWFEEKVVSESGEFYWKIRFEQLVANLQEGGKVTEVNTPLADLYYGLKIVPQI